MKRYILPVAANFIAVFLLFFVFSTTPIETFWAHAHGLRDVEGAMQAAAAHQVARYVIPAIAVLLIVAANRLWPQDVRARCDGDVRETHSFAPN